MTARLNIEPETVVAWTVIVVGIYYLLTGAGKLLLRRRGDGHAESQKCE